MDDLDYFLLLFLFPYPLVVLVVFKSLPSLIPASFSA